MDFIFIRINANFENVRKKPIKTFFALGKTIILDEYCCLIRTTLSEIETKLGNMSHNFSALLCIIPYTISHLNCPRTYSNTQYANAYNCARDFIFYGLSQLWLADLIADHISHSVWTELGAGVLLMMSFCVSNPSVSGITNKDAAPLRTNATH